MSADDAAAADPPLSEKWWRAGNPSRVFQYTYTDERSQVSREGPYAILGLYKEHVCDVVKDEVRQALKKHASVKSVECPERLGPDKLRIKAKVHKYMMDHTITAEATISVD